MTATTGIATSANPAQQFIRRTVVMDAVSQKVEVYFDALVQADGMERIPGDNLQHKNAEKIQ